MQGQQQDAEGQPPEGAIHQYQNRRQGIRSSRQVGQVALQVCTWKGWGALAGYWSSHKPTCGANSCKGYYCTTHSCYTWPCPRATAISRCAKGKIKASTGVTSSLFFRLEPKKTWISAILLCHDLLQTPLLGAQWPTVFGSHGEWGLCSFAAQEEQWRDQQLQRPQLLPWTRSLLVLLLPRSLPPKQLHLRSHVNLLPTSTSRSPRMVDHMGAWDAEVISKAAAAAGSPTLLASDCHQGRHAYMKSKGKKCWAIFR